MFTFFNETNWWCLFLLLLLSFILGWFLSKWVYNEKKNIKVSSRLSHTNTSDNEQATVVKSTFTTSETIAPDQGSTNIKAIKTRHRNGVPANEELPKLNFDRFGKATASERDNLKLIKGVGPFIEDKLNGIGIYTFDQISKFTKEDIDTVTQLIQFFPGRIERDDWKQQAIDLKNK
ncbi:hypothetical protein ACE939_06655 [Aquimarina sp. W85]|uniref:hypothetical protein n=1 Tax=Aquimarina rhodophyticola TaxID=3342246 RepID=UPI00366F1FA9